MRTTFDLPDDLYRRLKAHAALNGVPMRDALKQFIETGLEQDQAIHSAKTGRRDPLPVFEALKGVSIPYLSPAELRRIEEEEDEERYGRSS
ncbi:MAG TPA: hypothetical protein PLJ47_00945 [Candidatus Hydrogenedentes bacterium]|nr:hypothetical protein [Candidatus Hydrogenedentota bacterium]